MGVRNFVGAVAITSAAMVGASCAPEPAPPGCPARQRAELPVPLPAPPAGSIVEDPHLRFQDLSPDGRYGVGVFEYRLASSPIVTGHEGVLVDVRTGAAERFPLASDRRWTVAVDDMGDVVAVAQDDGPGLLRSNNTDTMTTFETPPAVYDGDEPSMYVVGWHVSEDTRTLVRSDTYAVWNPALVRYDMGATVRVIDRVAGETRSFDTGLVLGYREFPEYAVAVSPDGRTAATQRHLLDLATGALTPLVTHTAPPVPPEGAAWGDYRPMATRVTNDGRKVVHWAVPGQVNSYPAWFGGYVSMESTSAPASVTGGLPISNPWSVGIAADGSRIMGSRSESGVVVGSVWEATLPGGAPVKVEQGVIGGAYSADLHTFAGWVTDATGDHFLRLTCG